MKKAARKNSDTDDEREEEPPENMQDPAPTDHKELARNFKSVATLTSADLLQNAFRTSMCLERGDKGCHQGEVMFKRQCSC